MQCPCTYLRGCPRGPTSGVSLSPDSEKIVSPFPDVVRREICAAEEII